MKTLLNLAEKAIHLMRYQGGHNTPPTPALEINRRISRQNHS